MENTKTTKKISYIKLFIIALFLLIIMMLSYSIIRMHRQIKKFHIESAKKLSSDIVEIICPSDWTYEQVVNSFRFLHPDGSIIIFDIFKNHIFYFMPLDRNLSRASSNIQNTLLRYGMKIRITVTEVNEDKISGIPALLFTFKTEDNKGGIALISYYMDYKITYIGIWTGAEFSHTALVCKNCKNFISIKKPQLRLYTRPIIDSANFVDNYEIITKTDNFYEQAKQLWQTVKDSPNDIVSSVNAYQNALSTLALSNSGGLIYDKASILLEDAQKAANARIDNLEKMKGLVTQYIKIGDTNMAEKIIENMLDTVIFENELSYKEWALKTKMTLTKSESESE
ncbi:MAG TPA: hypothetical protein PLN24_04315 [Victivallales bacterium]|nr:hypothetical protein [Victivallales bacterium]